MFKKLLCFGLVLSFILVSAVLADYYPNEKPVWGLTQDTAYLLNKGEWHLDIWGWTTYGYSDNFQIGSNFWLDVGQLMNVYTKVKIVEERKKFPALSLGASYYTTLVSSIGFWDASIYLSKTLEEDKHWFYGGVKYMDLRTGATDGVSLTGQSGVNLTLGTITRQAKHWSSFLEFSFGTTANTSAARGGAGFEWAFGSMRYRIGGYITGTSFVPLLDFSWRF